METARVIRQLALGGEPRTLTPGRALPDASAPSGASAAQADQALGYSEGLRQGLADAAARIDAELASRQRQWAAQHEQAEAARAQEHAQRLATLEALLQTMQKALPAHFQALENLAIELAYEALCRIAGPGQQHAGLLADVIRHGMDQLRGQPLLAVRIHPADLASLRQCEAGRRLLDQHAEVRWHADAKQPRSGCLLESDHGQLDVGLQTQLARLRDHWMHADGTAAVAPVAA